jgi:hypothetical protein
MVLKNGSLGFPLKGGRFAMEVPEEPKNIGNRDEHFDRFGAGLAD